MLSATARAIFILGLFFICVARAGISHADLSENRSRALVAFALEARIERWIDEQYPDLASADEWTLKQIIFSKLLVNPHLLNQMGVSVSQVQAWKESGEPLPEQVWMDLSKRADFVRKQELHKVLARLMLPLAPPPSKGTILTIEAIKGWVAFNLSAFGAAMMGSGIVPYDSQVGQILAPISILSAIYLLMRGVVIMRRFAEQERQLIEWDEAVHRAASDSQSQGESKGLFALAIAQRTKQSRPRASCAQSFGVFRTPSG